MFRGGVFRLSRTARDALLLTLAVWFVFVYGTYVLSELMAGRTAFVRDLALDLPAVFLVALTAQALYPLAVYGAERSVAFRWISIFAAAVAVAAVQAGINIAENRLLGVIPALHPDHVDMIRDRFGRSFLSHLYISFANGALFVVLVDSRRQAEQRLRLAEAEALAEAARSAALRLQLNPHFLFNTLNSISSLVVTNRPDDAEEMIAQLSDFLRLTLNADPAALVPLEEEYATIAAYLDIEAVRFGSRMQADLSFPQALANAPVPSFILQPLVENALKYGVARSAGPATIRVLAEQAGGELRLRVVNTAPAASVEAPTAAGLGIGLDNIERRLASRYGDAARLTVSRDAGQFIAEVTLPLS